MILAAAVVVGIRECTTSYGKGFRSRGFGGSRTRSRCYERLLSVKFIGKAPLKVRRARRGSF